MVLALGVDGFELALAVNAAYFTDFLVSTAFRFNSWRKGLGLSHSWLRSMLFPFAPVNLGCCLTPVTPGYRKCCIYSELPLNAPLLTLSCRNDLYMSLNSSIWLIGEDSCRSRWSCLPGELSYVASSSITTSSSALLGRGDYYLFSLARCRACSVLSSSIVDFK